MLWLWQFSAVQREMRRGEGAREWTRIHANGRKWDFAQRRGGGEETGERMAETENQGRVGSPSGPKIQARSAAWREEGLSQGRRGAEGGNRKVAEF